MFNLVRQHTIDLSNAFLVSLFVNVSCLTPNEGAVLAYNIDLNVFLP